MFFRIGGRPGAVEDELAVAADGDDATLAFFDAVGEVAFVDEPVVPDAFTLTVSFSAFFVY